MMPSFEPDPILTAHVASAALLQTGQRSMHRARARRFSAGAGLQFTCSSTRERHRRKSESSFSLQLSPLQTIVRELRERMRAQMSVIPDQYAQFQFILLRCTPLHFEELYHEILRKWLYEPLFVTNEELGHILDIQLSTSLSPKLLCSSLCYFRSWNMYAWQLQVVTEDLISQGFSSELLGEWLFMLQTCSRNTVVTPRYVGTTSRHPTLGSAHKLSRNDAAQ
ncbi:hypothetical protein PWT90_05998 [Aphanocladium album]|nr:hypothetical protein PWT90_05998 [Aphanocladium album]